MTKPHWSQGVTLQGPVVLRDGVPVEITNIVDGLNRLEDMRLMESPRPMGKATPVQTLRNLSAEELSDHVSIGGTLPQGAIRHLVMKLENVNTLAHATRADYDTSDELVNMTDRPLEDWDGV